MGSTDRPGEAAAISPEVRLLLATAGGAEQDPLVVALARQPLDWGRFLQLVLRERAEAIVSARLTRCGFTLPEAIGRELKSSALRSDLRMTTLSHRLDQTICALAAAGIPVLLLKGAALGRSVYGSMARRPMLDLDLLVPEAERPRARAAALATGWVTGEMENQVEFYRGHYHMAPLHDGQTHGFNLEIHSALFPAGHPFVWPTKSLWERSRPLPGSSARLPSPEDLLLHVALHFSWSHLARFAPWRAFRDIRAMVEDPSLDWGRFLEFARATRGATAAYWTLRLAQRYAGVRLPATVETLAPALPAPVLRVLDRHFAGQWEGTTEGCPSMRLERWLWRVAIRPGQSGHGESVPWLRDPLFQRPDERRVAEPGSRKLARHLRQPGRYLAYLQRVVLGIAR